VRWASDAFSLRAAAYRGWRLPTLNELYRPFRVGAGDDGE
jgi:outer membrane receptor protein involved in Fe transport